MEHGSAFLYEDLGFFFTPSQLLDFYLGIKQPHSLQHVLSLLEQHTIQSPPLLALFASLFRPITEGQLRVERTAIAKLVDNDGVKLILASIEKQLQRLQEKDGDTLDNQFTFKLLINILYVCIDFLQHNPDNPNSSTELNRLYQDSALDDLLMKMVTLSLVVHYIPVKKLTMLYTRVLANLFHHSSPLPPLSPKYIYSDNDAAQLPLENLLRFGQLEKLKNTHPPINSPHSDKAPPIERYYRKHNTGECPLAQSIVVGLLRSLLTICNCQAHKRFTTQRGSGVDSFRQWQLSYRWVLEHPEQLSNLPPFLSHRLKTYQAFDQQPYNEGPLWEEFYTHKIYTTSAISAFFTLLLLAFKHNNFLQYSYFLQLISDANGILVFLKFLTDKFTSLETVTQTLGFRSDNSQTDPSFRFKERTMLTVYSVLLMLHASCNNYPQKIRNYLFQYNSYLIIKKIPSLFASKDQKLRNSNNKEDEPTQSSQSSSLPSRKELEQLEKQSKGCSPKILLKLTELCFDLLKIQIPFFSKKMKQNAANMKLIIDIYCKFPRISQPITLSPLQKLFLKSKATNTKQQKFITSVQEMKSIHNEYNNLYYWSNDFAQQQLPPSNRLEHSLNNLIEPQLWLEQNIWKYYD